MTTTTSTTATPTPTTSSVVSSAAQSLLTSLNAGSGVDTASLVTSLVTAQYAAQTAALSAKYDTLTSQISGVSTLKSAITTFSSALDTLVKGGTLAAQPVSSNGAVLSASALSGAQLSGLSTSITVSQLASAQTAVSASAVADHSAAIGTGSFTLTFGTATYGNGAMTGFTAGATPPVTIAIDAAHSSLDGIASAINAQRAGVTASVVTDADGSAYLSLKSATGAAQAFTLAATSDPSGGLAQFAVGPGASGTTITGQAANAKLKVDGVAVERASNTVSDLVSGVKLQLNATSAVPVTLSSTTPTDALSGAVSDFVSSYNEVVKLVTAQTDPVSGALKADTGATGLLASMRGLTLKTLLPAAATGTPSTLAELGVRTNKDGTLEVDANTLSHALSTWPDLVAAMFAPSSDGTTGIAAAMKSLTLAATSTVYGLGASTSRYTQAQSDISDRQSTLSDQKDAMTTRLTSQFTSMNTKVSAYKSVQSFLTNQIAAWNKSGS